LIYRYLQGYVVPSQTNNTMMTEQDYPSETGTVHTYPPLRTRSFSFGSGSNYPYYSENRNNYFPFREKYLSIIEEDTSIPYDLNGNGTKFSTNNNLKRVQSREFVRQSPPSENMHTYYPSYETPMEEKNEYYNTEVNYGESIPISPELIPYENYGEDFGGMNERKRKFEEVNQDLDVPYGFKLPASKSPIMEAMAYCAINRWGIEIVQCQDQTDDSPAKVVFRVLDFELYYKYSCAICSKQNPTEDIGSRVKSLRRWFVNFPKKRDRREYSHFSLEVKPEVSKKVYEMVEKYKCNINVNKKRRLTI